MIECLVVADDLTGACDAAVHFAVQGMRPTMVDLPGYACPGTVRVLARSTESRDFAPDAIRGAVVDLAAEYAGTAAARVFKKIDSTLRGNAGRETTSARDAFGCDAVVVCPAFPAMHRVVECGSLRVTNAPQFAPIDVAVLLSAQAGEVCVRTVAKGVTALLAEGARLISVDAACDADLGDLARVLIPFGRRILWAGSAGLASALVRCVAPSAVGKPIAPHSQRGPVLFCLGSDHEVTLAQQNAVLAERPSVLLAAGSACEAITAAVAAGQHAVLRIARGQAPVGVGALRPAALAVSGGDTASLVFRAIGARAIELCGEIVPGVPHGILRGGAFDGLPVVTKSGGFGERDTLIRVADFFSCHHLKSPP